MVKFDLRNTGEDHCVRDLLVRAFPEFFASFSSTGICKSATEIRKGSNPIRSLDERVLPGERLHGEFSETGWREFVREACVLSPLPALRLGEGDGWSIVVVPGGWASPWLSTDLPMVRTAFQEVIPHFAPECHVVLPRLLDVCGLRLVAHGEGMRSKLDAAFAEGRIELCARALLPTPPWPDGMLGNQPSGDERTCTFRVVRAGDGIAEIEFLLRGYELAVLRSEFGRCGLPILGDACFEGRMVAGGLRLWVTRIAIESDGVTHIVELQDALASLGSDLVQAGNALFSLPTEAVFPIKKTDATLTVSHATARALGKGHPWLLWDRQAGDAGRFRHGSIVRIVEERTQRTLGEACVEAGEKIIARRWSVHDGLKTGRSSIEERVAKALKKRSALFETQGTSKETNAFRIVHGEADGLPGFFVDHFAGILRVLLTSSVCDGFSDRAMDALSRGIEKWLGNSPPTIEVVHWKQQPFGKLRCVFVRHEQPLSAYFDEDGRLIVRENGLRYWVRLGLEDPFQSRPGVGLFPDQRANRERVAAIASRRGGRWLNLFAHTGAFSVSLLAAGAEHVTSVDLSAPYLDWLGDNLKANQLLDGRHRSIRGDGRRVLDQLLTDGERFDGIILDPPTAAASGRRFWEVRREGERLFERVLRGLRPGGSLLLCRNDRQAAPELRRWIEGGAKSSGVILKSVELAPPSFDFPRQLGFPEGDAFVGFLLTAFA